MIFMSCWLMYHMLLGERCQFRGKHSPTSPFNHQFSMAMLGTVPKKILTLPCKTTI